MSATLTATSTPIQADAPADALPDGARVFRGILIGGLFSCGLWAGIVALVLSVV